MLKISLLLILIEFLIDIYFIREIFIFLLVNIWNLLLVIWIGLLNVFR